MLQTTKTNVIYKKRHKELKHGHIQLIQNLSKDTMWADVVTAGPDSILKSGDEILLSARPVSYEFEFDGELMYNTSDASTMSYKRNGVLGATCGTILYEWIEEPEKVTESGIVIIEKVANQELQPRWAFVHAAGPDSGVMKGDNVLLAFKSDAYTIHIDGIELHNAGKEEVIAFTRL